VRSSTVASLGADLNRAAAAGLERAGVIVLFAVAAVAAVDATAQQILPAVSVTASGTSVKSLLL
jgi:hypothetical protein